MTACRDRIEKLDELFAGGLEDREADELRAHLEGCEGCRAYHDRLWRVEAALERKAMPSRAVDGLERRLLARVQAETPAPSWLERLSPEDRPAQAGRSQRPPWLERLRGLWAGQSWLRIGAPLAAAAALAVLVVALPDRPGSGGGEFRPRAGGTGPAYGVRAHCVGNASAVTGEARPGERLSCPEGSWIQLSVTAPEPVLFTAVAHAPDGRSHDLASRAPVGPGTDVPLPFSTPSLKSWLSGPTRLTVRFESSGGELLAERELVLLP